MSRSTSDSELFPPEVKSFWKTVEEFSSEVVPDYLKQIITAAGYDRYPALKKFSDEMKLELERFARERIPVLFPPESIARSVYLRNPKQFKLVPGHIQLLKGISQKLPENLKHFDKIRRKHAESLMRCESRQEARQGQVVQAEGQASSTAGSGSGIMHDIRGENHIGNPKNSTAHITTIDGKIQRWITAKKFRMPSPHAEVNVTGYRRATVKCWYCLKAIALSSRTNKNGSWYWIISNFTQHILDHKQSRPNVTIASYFKIDSEPVFERESDEVEREADTSDEDAQDRAQDVYEEANILCTDADCVQEEGNEYYEEYLDQEQTMDNTEVDLQENSVVNSVKTEISNE